MEIATEITAKDIQDYIEHLGKPRKQCHRLMVSSEALEDMKNAPFDFKDNVACEVEHDCAECDKKMKVHVEYITEYCTEKVED